MTLKHFVFLLSDNLLLLQINFFVLKKLFPVLTTTSNSTHWFVSLKPILEVKVKVLVAQTCPTLCDPMDYSPPSISGNPTIGLSGKNIGVDSHSLHQGIFPTQVSHTAGRLFTSQATRELWFLLQCRIYGIVSGTKVKNNKYLLCWACLSVSQVHTEWQYTTANCQPGKCKGDSSSKYKVSVHVWKEPSVSPDEIKRKELHPSICFEGLHLRWA